MLLAVEPQVKPVDAAKVPGVDAKRRTLDC